MPKYIFFVAGFFTFLFIGHIFRSPDVRVVKPNIAFKPEITLKSSHKDKYVTNCGDDPLAAQACGSCCTQEVWNKGKGTKKAIDCANTCLKASKALCLTEEDIEKNCKKIVRK